MKGKTCSIRYTATPRQGVPHLREGTLEKKRYRSQERPKSAGEATALKAAHFPRCTRKAKRGVFGPYHTSLKAGYLLYIETFEAISNHNPQNTPTPCHDMPCHAMPACIAALWYTGHSKRKPEEGTEEQSYRLPNRSPCLIELAFTSFCGCW